MNDDGEIDMVFFPDKRQPQQTRKYLQEVKQLLQIINQYTETWTWDNFRSILTDYYHGQYSPANRETLCGIS